MQAVLFFSRVCQVKRVIFLCLGVLHICFFIFASFLFLLRQRPAWVYFL